MGDHEAHGGERLNEADHPAAAPDADDGSASLETGRRLFAQACTLVISAASLAQVPACDRAEVAFAGRSNVGKSSLINALTGQRRLAHTSATPGRTQQINFFSLGERLTLVDLPGYGYAKAAKGAVAAWTRLIETYLTARVPLRRVLILIDARHGLKDGDRRVMALLDRAAVPYQAVLTKADKVPAALLAATVDSVAAELLGHGAAHPWVAVTSAASGSGIPELRAALARLADWTADPTPPEAEK